MEVKEVVAKAPLIGVSPAELLPPWVNPLAPVKLSSVTVLSVHRSRLRPRGRSDLLLVTWVRKWQRRDLKPRS